MHQIIQIAGIRNRKEAQMLVEAGVDWLGFPLRLPVHREDITEQDAAKIIRRLPPKHRGVLITYLTGAYEILALCRRLGVAKVQVHGDIPFAELLRLRQSAPGLFIIKSLIVRGENLAELTAQVATLSPVVDGFITDTHDPATGATGATGKTHDWQISRRLAEISPRPLMLAGGLNPENVAQAIRTVRPAAVDAHTGVEDETGAKCPEKIRRFVAAARAAFREIVAT